MEANTVEGQSWHQKDKEGGKGKAQREKRPKVVGHLPVQKLSATFLSKKYLSWNFDFCKCLSKNVVKRGASGKKDMLSTANAFLNTLELIWPICMLKICKMSKKYALVKSCGSQWAKLNNFGFGF